MHLLPCKLLTQAFDDVDLRDDSDASVTVPARLLRLMLEAILEYQDVDEQAYRSANPDVASAVQSGRIRSGYDHYKASGYFEGRRGAEGAFDEEWYLTRYPDVRQAVSSGKYATGWDHFQAEGAMEWRSPNERAEPDLHRWRVALGLPTQASKKDVSAGRASAAGKPTASVAAAATRRLATATGP